MASTAEITNSETVSDHVTYEQPLNERLRTFLRLDFLFKQTAHHASVDSPWNGRATIASLLEILAILGRGDVRQEIIKELERLTGSFSLLAKQPGVDNTRLDALLLDLQNLRKRLDVGTTSTMTCLRESVFLNSIKHRSAIPGGTCEFDLPDFKHWLLLPMAQRDKDYSMWMNSLAPIRDGVDRVLWLLRESSQTSEQRAKSGMYQHVIDRDITCQMIRVALPRSSNLYPEISGSSHRFTIRFYQFSTVEDRPVQCTDDVDFMLMCCG